MNLLEEIDKSISQKYPYLRLLEIVYDKKIFTCTISFLFPEWEKDIDEKDRKQLELLIKDKGNINSRVIVKTKKSFLDLDNISTSILDFIKENYVSLFNLIKRENIKIKKDEKDLISINFSFNQLSVKNINMDIFINSLKESLSTNYYANFNITYEINNNEWQESDLSERKDNKLKIATDNIVKTRRYKVYDVVKLVGKDITPEPEYIEDIKDIKSSVILSGVINKFECKTFMSKFKQNKEMTYYKFILKDYNAQIPVIYFCSNTNIPKMEKLGDGSVIILVGDVKKGFQDRLELVAKSISYCTMASEELPQKEVVKPIEEEINSEYKFASPEPYVSFSQAQLFEKAKRYNNFVQNKNLVVFDVETTGLNPENCEIVEIGAVKVCDGKLAEKFQVLIKPHNPIPSSATEIHGITNEMVSDCNYGEDIIKDFYHFCEGCTLVGYNVNFDYKFIQALASKVNLSFENEISDAMAFARKQLNIKTYTLSAVVKSMELKLDNAHRAFYDALATAEVYLKLNEII